MRVQHRCTEGYDHILAAYSGYEPVGHTQARNDVFYLGQLIAADQRSPALVLASNHILAFSLYSAASEKHLTDLRETVGDALQTGCWTLPEHLANAIGDMILANALAEKEPEAVANLPQILALVETVPHTDGTQTSLQGVAA